MSAMSQLTRGISIMKNIHMGVSENSVSHLPNGFADHYPYEKWLAIIGKINPTFSEKGIFPMIASHFS